MAEQQTTEQITQPHEPETKVWELDYQAVDENGQPIGRKTHLGPFKTPEELIEAQRKQNEEAVRAYFRVKNAKLDPNTQPNFEPKQWDASEQLRVANEFQQPETIRKAFRETIEAEFGAPVEQVRDTFRKAAAIDAKFEVDAFLIKHQGIDYYPCQENQAAIEAWLVEQKADITTNNLEVALNALDMAGKLVPVPETKELSASTIEPEEHETNPPAPRRSASTGIIPGQFNGTRQGTRKPGLTKADIAKMPTAELKRRMANPKLREEIERVANGG